MQRARTERSKASRKNDILDGAEAIISTEGLSGLSLKAVAKKANLAIGTIYLYFEKKEDLIAALTLKSRRFLLEKFSQSIQSEENALRQLTQLLTAYFDFYISHPHYNELVSFFEKNAGLEEPPELVQASLEINKLVSQVVEKGKLRNQIRPDVDAATFSFLLWGTAVGIIQLIEVKKTGIKKGLQKTEREFYFNYVQLICNSVELK
jgi:AcrR family transcriptional regulator